MAGDARRPPEVEEGDDLDQGAFVDINVTPLVDIFLVLLVILMATSTAILESGQGPGTGFQVQLPEGSESDDVHEETNALVIAVSSDGSIVVDGETLSMAELKERFKREVGNPKKVDMVLVQADEDARHKRVVEVMEAAREAGLTTLGIATRQ